MADHPYEITWTDENGAGHSTVLFGKQADDALKRLKRAESEMEITHVYLSQAGRSAECMVRYTLRGGRVYGETFYYHDGKGPQSVPLSEVTGLRYHE